MSSPWMTWMLVGIVAAIGFFVLLAVAVGIFLLVRARRKPLRGFDVVKAEPRDVTLTP